VSTMLVKLLFIRSYIAKEEKWLRRNL